MKVFKFIKNFIITFIVIISSFFLIISLIRIDKYFVDKEVINKYKDLYKSEVEIKEDLKDKTWFNPPADKNEEYYSHIDKPFLSVDFTNLLKENLDTVAYLKVNGTNVEYPVVQSSNNKYYLDHSFYRDYSFSGSIFSDFRNNFRVLNNNSVIYGHGMLDLSMFGSIRFGLTEEWYENNDNHLIYLSTPYYNMIFLIFSVYVIKDESYYITTHFKNENEYIEFLNTIKGRSKYEFNTSLNSLDKILTLSTCNDTYGVEKVVVHAKLIKREART